MRVIVSDASVLFDLADADLLLKCFELPYEPQIADVMFEEKLVSIGAMRERRRTHGEPVAVERASRSVPDAVVDARACRGPRELERAAAVRRAVSRSARTTIRRSRSTLEFVDKADNSADSKAEVVTRLRARKAEIAALGVKRLGLFGSFVRDEAGPDSDVDLLVEFEPGRKSFDSFMRLSDLLEDVLQRPIELVTVEALSLHIGPAILESAEYVTEAA